MPQLYTDRTLRAIIFDQMDTLENESGREVTQSEALLSLLPQDVLDEYERRLTRTSEWDFHITEREARLKRCREYRQIAS